MEVSGQFHASSPISPGKETVKNCVRGCGWGVGGSGGTQSVWTIWETETSPSDNGNGTSIPQKSCQAPSQDNGQNNSVTLRLLRKSLALNMVGTIRGVTKTESKKGNMNMYSCRHIVYEGESRETLKYLYIFKYRVIQNDCRGFNNLSYTIHLR